MSASANLDKARALYEKAQEADRLEQEKAAAQAAAELKAADERFLATYDDEQLAQDVVRAQQELRAAAAADPVFTALARVYALQLRRAHLSSDAHVVAGRLGSARLITTRSAGMPDVESLLRLIADLGEEMHNAQRDD